MYSHTASVDVSVISDLHSSQSVKRLDQADPVMAERFSRLMTGAKEALGAGTTVLAPSKSNGDEAAPRSLAQDVISDVAALERGIGTIFEMNKRNGEKHAYLEGKQDVANVGQVLLDYQHFGIRYFIAANYANKTGISTMEEIQIFTKGR